MTNPYRWALLGGLPCTICLVLLVAVLVLIPWGLPSVMLSEGRSVMLTGWTLNPWAKPALLGFGVCLVIQFVLALWVGFDANRRGLNGFLWGALVFFTCVVGLVVYLIVSRPATADGRIGGATCCAPLPHLACSSCGATLQPDYRVCPFCGHALGSRCRTCNQAVSGEWKVCPHCATPLGETS